MEAARNNQKEICKFLINKGVNINLKNMFGLAPLHIAADSDLCDLYTLIYLVEHGADLNM